MAVTDDNRRWLLDVARGDINHDDACDVVRTMRLRDDLAEKDPELAAALAEGDQRYGNDPRRWHEGPAPWERDIDVDPATNEAFDKIIEARWDPDTDGEVVYDDDSMSLADRMRSALLDTAGVMALPPPSPLIDDYLMLNSLAVLFAPSGAGKTFLALDWALHVAAMPWWNHHDVHGGPVVYVIAEGASGIGKRIGAWTTHHATPLNGYPIHWLPRAVNLTDLGEVYAFIDIVVDLNPALIVLDTLARCIVGAEENSAKDMGLVVASLDRIRRATAACVLAVHHTGKDVSAGSRGHSSLKGALDTEIELSATDEHITVKVPKQKDDPEAKPLHLTRIPAGDSCVLVPATRGDDDGEIGAGAAATLETLRTIQVPGGIAAGVWEAASEASRRSFYTHRSRLLNLGLVRNIGTEKQPRYAVAPNNDDNTDDRDEALSAAGGAAVQGHSPPAPALHQQTPGVQDTDLHQHLHCTASDDQGKHVHPHDTDF